MIIDLSQEISKAHPIENKEVVYIDIIKNINDCFDKENVVSYLNRAINSFSTLLIEIKSISFSSFTEVDNKDINHLIFKSLQYFMDYTINNSFNSLFTSIRYLVTCLEIKQN